MTALGTVVRAGVGRRRVQTVVMTLTTTLAVTATVLAVGLLVASQAPFDHAFAEQHGAHLIAQVDGRKAGPAQLAATAHVAGVIAASGPDPVLSLNAQLAVHGPGMPSGVVSLPPLTVAGRTDPGGSVDDVDLISGSWARQPGQIVLAADHILVNLGDRLTFPREPGSPTLTVVGLARSVSQSADGWVAPAQLSALTTPGSPASYQMRYRFSSATTDAELVTDRARIAAALPPGSITGASSYLKVKLAADRESAVFVPFIVAFGVLGLVMSILIISIVVSGAVGAGTRRIGILKSLGFTPAQVVRAYIGQALIPATIGTGLGIVIGNLLSIPVLATAESAYRTGALGIPIWVDVVVAAGLLAVVTVTALAPALRAGRLRAIEAIAIGRTPSVGRGRVVRRLIGRLPLSRPVSLGLAIPFARPTRTATLAAAVAFGTIGVTFGIGLALSLNGIQSGTDRDSAGDVIVQLIGPGAASGPGGPSGPAGPATATTAHSAIAANSAISAKIRAQPGTQRYFSTSQTQVSVAGLTGAPTLINYQGDSSWGAYQIIAGSWFTGPGQADVPTGFLKATGSHLGDIITLTSGGRSVPVRLVGEVLSLRDEGMTILTGDPSLTGLDGTGQFGPTQFNIQLTPGTSKDSYVNALNEGLQPLGAEAEAASDQISSTVVAIDSLAAILTAMLVAVAALGVFNLVVLDTRERVHDLGVFKALGMSPRQTIAMVLTSVGGIGVLAGIVGVPAGIALHGYVMPAMGRAAGTRIPNVDLAVYRPGMLVVLLFGGLIIAITGALVPAGWAAGTGTATALRTE